MEVHFNEANTQILAKLVWQEYSTLGAYLLNGEANGLSTQDGFDRLLALETLPDIVLYRHQQETVLKVLKELRGRAVLADEVGLGKTIEAGIIMKEYLLRSLAKRILVLVPASLVSQWYEELVFRFNMPFKVQDGSVPWQEDLLLASIDYAKREPQRTKISSSRYDLIVVDEAHKLKNSATVNWQFVNGLRKTFLLLLTATPVQNDLKELYNLITLLKPGQLKTYREFKKEFIQDKRTPKNPEKLRSLLKQVMVRSNRRETMLKLPKRVVNTKVIQVSQAEKLFCEAAVASLRQVYLRKNKARQSVLPLIVLAREICSSPLAAVTSLQMMCERDKSLSSQELEGVKAAIAKGKAIRQSSKCVFLQKMLETTSSKVLVFTEFRATQEYLATHLRNHGYKITLFHGGLSLPQKDEAVFSFRHQSQVMISTEAGGEGRNLQFCHILVNYDLPWNPMRVEQRIGRVHRLGQQNDVHIFNLVSNETIEEYVLYLLSEKLRLFSDIVGDIEAIISASGISIEREIADRFFGIKSSPVRQQKSNFDDKLAQFVESYRDLQDFTDGLLGVGP